MIKSAFLLTIFSILTVTGIAQTGTLQIYCAPDVRIYVDDRYQGKTSADHSGLLLENLRAGEVTVRAVRPGHQTLSRSVILKEDSVNEVSLELVRDSPIRHFTVGADLHFGMFGLFNVNDDFTKAGYSFGVTPFADYRFHQNFAIGAEVMSMWGKPVTSDDPRWMLCPNVRVSGIFSPFHRVGFHLLVAGGFSYWPENPALPELTPTLNDNRFGWDVRAMAGVDFTITESSTIRLNFGYWASSTTSDDVVWITHDTMLLGLGYRFRL